MAVAIPVWADRSRIIQILANLLSNAIKYSPPQTAIEMAIIAPASGGAFLQVDVRDQGPGIAPDDIMKLFQKFYRVDNSSTRSKPGQALGLPSARPW